MRPAFGGIDFGTSNSTVGVIENGKPRLVPLEGGQFTLPSAVFFNFEDNHSHVGRRAIADYTDGVEGRLMRALKSVLGSSLVHEKTRIKSRSMAFTDIIGLFIGELKARMEDFTGQPAGPVVFGRPVQFVDDDAEADRNAQNELEKAARARGFGEIAFQFEPIAAALDYERSVAREELALIVDMGGGTSDFSVVRVSPERATGSRPERRHPGQPGRPHRRHRFRPAAQHRPCDARTRLSDADQGRQAQPAGGLFRRPRDLAAHQSALHVEGEDRPQATAPGSGAARPRRAADRDRRPALGPFAGRTRRTGEDRDDRGADGAARRNAAGRRVWRRPDPRGLRGDDRRTRWSVLPGRWRRRCAMRASLRPTSPPCS